MKTLILVCSFLTILISQTRTQFFTGEIHYKTTFVPKNNFINIDSLLQIQHGTSSLYLITDGYYKTTYFKGSRETYSYTYHDETKRMYDAKAGQPYITYRDSRKGNVDSVTYFIHRDSTATLLGYKCYLFKKIYPDFTIRSWYSNDVRINPEPFKGHATGNWYEQLLKTNGGIALKTVTEYNDYWQIDEVVNMVPRRVKKSEFDLPEGVPFVASFMALDKPVSIKEPDKQTITCYQKKFAQRAKVDNVQNRYTSYVRFVLTDKGEIHHVSAYEEDPYGLYKIAISILIDCGFEFNPGEINGKAVSSEVYFPVEF